MKIAFHTLGCKVNQNDSQAMAELFRGCGHEIVPFEEGADVYIINTCAVTKVSEQKSRQIIRKGMDLNPKALVVVTGCYAQTSPQEIVGLKGVHLVVGLADRPRLAELVGEYFENGHNQVHVTAIDAVTGWHDLPVFDPQDRTRATLKIEDGCNEFCSYCIVPYARGRVRSMPIRQVIDSFTVLVGKGFREIVLTGIHLGHYGKDLNSQLDDLLEQLLKIAGDYRIRLGSLEPKDVTDELLNLIGSEERICQHLHIPLQSGSDRILQKMGRNYDLSYYSDLIRRARKVNPLMSIGTDLIVGFPGESDLDFEDTCRFVESQQFSKVHVFRFSPRSGTPAATMPDQVFKKIKEERSQRIQQIAFDSAFFYARFFMGKDVKVLFEEKTAEGWSGLSGEYLRVIAHSDLDLKNRMQTVRIDEQKNDHLLGSLCLEKQDF
ncbi:MAG TPA: tRNA (N(6)-L-threonylcarbamoyladenosine(37)-C(2))-methylthiotransferase MtaB [Firmicutes bacterium]|jgi:threonylcarbamoyladenosine tRNA methylthiotransferase MtaB|nr:tRNA (N(6)-L-threonylcarbamoyladenosine(37)-C(2))-methylthiotransferase MtaB [Bacillota bacterium]